MVLWFTYIRHTVDKNISSAVVKADGMDTPNKTEEKRLYKQSRPRSMISIYSTYIATAIKEHQSQGRILAKGGPSFWTIFFRVIKKTIIHLSTEKLRRGKKKE